jgi:hypothetical protein
MPLRAEGSDLAVLAVMAVLETGDRVPSRVGGSALTDLNLPVSKDHVFSIGLCRFVFNVLS